MYKKTILLCWMCLLLLIGRVTAQKQNGSIGGSIRSQNGQIIAGATIILSSITDADYKQTAFANISGSFKFDGLLWGKYNISASYIGFKKYISQQISINANTPNAILMGIVLQNDDSKPLREVQVSAQKNFIEHRIDRTVVNVGALISNTGATAADALSQSPGVEVNDDDIVLRGREGVVVYIDNKPTHLAGKELVDYLKALPAGTLDKIEIMPIAPAGYGADGTAGVINIKTKKATNKGFNGSVTAGYNQGEQPKTNNSFNFNYKKGKLNFFGSAAYSLNKNHYNVNWDRIYSAPNPGLSPVLQQHNFEASTTNGIHYTAGIDYDASPKTTLGIVFNGSATAYVEHGDYRMHFNQPSGTTDSSLLVNSVLQQHTDRNSINFNLRHQFNHPGCELNINLDYLDHNNNSNQSSVNNTYLANNSFKSNYTLLSSNAFSAQVYGAKADITDQLPGSIKLGAGLQSTYSVRHTNGQYSNPVNNTVLINDSLTNRFDNTENINSVYISLQKNFKHFELQAGLRAENTNATAIAYGFNHFNGNNLQFNYTDIFPTVYLSYKVDSAANNRLTLSAGRRINRPNYGDLNPSVFFFDKYTSFSGNPLLQPAYTTNAELNYSQGSIFSTGLLYNTTHDQIISVYSLINQAIIQNNFNINRVNSYGVYVNPMLNITCWFSLNVYAQLIHTHYKGVLSSGIIIDNAITAFSGNGNVQFKFGKGWSAEISSLYRGKRSLGQGYYLPLWQLNSAIQKKLLNDKATISISARDIFHSFIINRHVNVQQVQLSRVITNDTQQVGIALSYKFGTSGKNRDHHTCIENEAGRVN